MATTITRESMTDNVTVWNVTRIGSAIYDRIDSLIANNITFGGTVGSETAGTHSFSASSSGSNVFLVRNTNSGTAAQAAIQIGNDTSASALTLQTLSSTFTGNNNLTQIASSIAGGLRLLCSHASGPFAIYTNSTARLTVSAAGVFTFGTGASIDVVPIAAGSSSAPSLAFASDLNTGIYSPSADIIRITAGGQPLMAFDYASVGNFVTVLGQTISNNGPTLTIERNSNSTGAPGILSLYDRSGTRYYLWVDTTGDLKIGTTAPSVIGGDTGGTVVGSQS